jgi:hypothetical protein
VKDDNQGVGVSEDCVFKQDENLTAQITLLEGLKLSGKILTEDQKPISKVQVHVSPLGHQGGGEQSQCNSDEEGNFELIGLKKGMYQISLRHGDYESVVTQMQYEAGNEDLSLVMRHSKNIIVTITTPDNSTPSKVTLYARPKYTNEHQIYDVKNIEGRYQFKSNQLPLAGQSFRLIAKADGFNPGESEIYSIENLPEQLEISLQVENSIQFNIINTMGEAIMGVNVSPKGRKPSGIFGDGQTFSTTTSDAEGVGVIKGLPDDEYDFEFKHNSYIIYQQNFKVSNQDLTPHFITLSRGAVLKGTVKDSQGELLKGASIWIQKNKESFNPITNINSQLSTQSDDLGRYMIQSIPAGEGQVFFSRKGNPKNNDGQKPNVVTFAEGDSLYLDLLEPEIENAGRLEVYLSEHWSEFFNIAGLNRNTGYHKYFKASKSNASFIFEKIPEGTYQLTLYGGAQGKVKNSVVSIKANQTTTIQINDNDNENYKVKALVVDEEGKPIPMGQTWLTQLDPSNHFRMICDPIVGVGTIQDGQLEISLEQPGVFDITLMSQDGQQTRSVSLGAVNIQNEGVTDLGTLTLKNDVILQGVTLRDSGEPLAHVQFMIVKNDTMFSSSHWLSDINGQFVIKGASLPKPPFQLIASLPGMADLRKEVKDLSPLRLIMSEVKN